MEQKHADRRLIGILSLATRYCLALENARETDKDDFTAIMLDLLPRIYWEFNDLQPEDECEDDMIGYASYVDEDYYDSIRRHVEVLFGPDDTFLETFEEDMKYSDTPIAASVSESLADIFQALADFAGVCRDTEGEMIGQAYARCHENFVAYWSQTLCNVLRALNNIRYRR